MYLPIGSGHSTLIKVSSIRSPGRGNRSITRTSALSTLSWTLIALPLSSNRRILSGRTSVYQTSCPLSRASLFPIDRAKYPRRSTRPRVWLLLREHPLRQHPLYRPAVRNTEGDGTRTSRYPSARGERSLSFSLFFFLAPVCS